MLWLSACHFEARRSPNRPLLFLKETCLHLVISDIEFLKSIYHNYRLTIPNASPIEVHVNCLNSTGRIYLFLSSQPCSAAYHDKAWA